MLIMTATNCDKGSVSVVSALTLGCRVNESSQNKRKGWRSLINLINRRRGFDILKYSLILLMNEKRDINGLILMLNLKL